MTQLIDPSVHAACANLVSAYNNLVDGGRASGVVALFADGGEMLVAGLNLSGESLKAAMAERERNTDRKTCHVSSNFELVSCDGDRAHGRSVILLYVLSPDSGALAPSAILRGEDDFIRGSDGVWRFLRREGTILAGGV